MDRIEELEKLLEQKESEAAMWKKIARKWEGRSKVNYRRIIRLEEEIDYLERLEGWR